MNPKTSIQETVIRTTATATMTTTMKKNATDSGDEVLAKAIFGILPGAAGGAVETYVTPRADVMMKQTARRWRCQQNQHI